MLFSLIFHHFHDHKKHHRSQGSSSSEEFSKIIEFLNHNFNLINPNEFIFKIEKKKLKSDDVCISFDDGLKSQIDIALPVLESFNLKAFFFIYTGIFCENPPLFEFFRDFRHSFDSVDKYYEIFFEKLKNYSPKSYEMLEKDYPENYLNHSLFYSENDKRYRFLRDQVLKQNYSEFVLQLMKERNYKFDNKKKKIFMSEDDLRYLSKNSHEVGLHSHTHPTTIGNYSYSQQMDEYFKNKVEIENIIKKEVISMSHPCGSYNSETLKVLEEINVKIGFCKSLNNIKFTSNLQIPREASSNFIQRYLK